MRILGVDFGTKRIGIAVADEGGSIAFPKEIIPNDRNGWKRFGEILAQEGIGEVVIGESLDFDGEENVVNKKLKDFAQNVTATYQIPVLFEKEFLTSFEAHGRMGKESNNQRKEKYSKPEAIDAKAAALILQRYLDRKNKKN